MMTKRWKASTKEREMSQFEPKLTCEDDQGWLSAAAPLSSRLEHEENSKEREDHNRSTNYIHATTYFSFLYNQPIHRIFACVWMDCVVVTSAWKS